MFLRVVDNNNVWNNSMLVLNECTARITRRRCEKQTNDENNDIYYGSFLRSAATIKREKKEEERNDPSVNELRKYLCVFTSRGDCNSRFATLLTQMCRRWIEISLFSHSLLFFRSNQNWNYCRSSQWNTLSDLKRQFTSRLLVFEKTCDRRGNNRCLQWSWIRRPVATLLFVAPTRDSNSDDKIGRSGRFSDVLFDNKLKGSPRHLSWELLTDRVTLFKVIRSIALQGSAYIRIRVYRGKRH